MQQDRILDIWIRIWAIIKMKLADVLQSNLAHMYTGVRESGLREDTSEQPTNVYQDKESSQWRPQQKFGILFFI